MKLCVQYRTRSDCTERQILDSSKLKDFADGNSNLIKENGRKFSKQVENTAGKGEIAMSPFSQQCFQKTHTADT